jgi:hypothetical protein
VLVEVREWTSEEQALVVQAKARAAEHELMASFLVQLVNANRLAFRMEN